MSYLDLLANLDIWCGRFTTIVYDKKLPDKCQIAGK